MLTEEEKGYMIEVLARQLGQSGNPRQDLVAPFFDSNFALELRGDNPWLLAMDAIRLCIRDAWDHTPTWLEMVIKTFQLNLLDGKVLEISLRVKNKPPAGPNPLESSILINGSPFVNRKSFRLKIEQLLSSATNTQPILVVTGKSRSGKSYSYNFIDHFSNIRKSGYVYRYEFDNDLGLEIGPERVAKDLVSKMGRSTSNLPGPETNLKLYSRQLATWVLNEAAQTEAHHWFVLDNFVGDKLRQETKDFINELTHLVNDGIFQKRCRIILIGFDASSLTVDPGRYNELSVEKCTATDIKNSIEEFLSFAPIPLDYTIISLFVINNLPPPPDQMPELNMRLRALLKAINSLKDILIKIPDVNFQDVLVQTLEGLPAGKLKMEELNNRLQELLETTNEMP